MQIRQHRSIEEVCNCLSLSYFCCAHQRTYDAFWVLHYKLQDGICADLNAIRRPSQNVTASRGQQGSGGWGWIGDRYVPPPVLNGVISSIVLLTCAIQYFVSGLAYNLMCKYSISYFEVMRSVWSVLEAVKSLPEFHISYPADHARQQMIATEFWPASSINFDNSFGTIDGLLVWISKPSVKDAERAGVSQKMLCSWKGKFGLNMQAVSNQHGIIFDFHKLLRIII